MEAMELHSPLKIMGASMESSTSMEAHGSLHGNFRGNVQWKFDGNYCCSSKYFVRE